MRLRNAGRSAGRSILGVLLVMVLFLSTVIPSYAEEAGTGNETATVEETGTENETATVKETGTENETAAVEETGTENETAAVEETKTENKTAAVGETETKEGNSEENLQTASSGDDSKKAAGGSSVPEGKAVLNGTIYDTVEDAVKAAASTGSDDPDVIYLGKGEYTLYGVSSEGTTKGKSLKFVGQGTGETSWQIGPEDIPAGTDPCEGKCGDYSFEKSSRVIFENMTLNTDLQDNGKGWDCCGFVRIDNTEVIDCVVTGRTHYWGYESAVFKNTTFNCPQGDYALWTYCSPTITFDHCTFNSSGKMINVYTDYSADKMDITVNYISCTVNNTEQNKPVLKINDKNRTNGYKFRINISGDNVVNGVAANKITCARLFGFDEEGENAGNTEVRIDDTLVWQNGKRVGGHEQDIEGEGSYKDGTAEGSSLQYTDGYKDDAYKVEYKINGAWVDKSAAQNDGWVDGERTVRKTCEYCGYKTEYTEYETEPEPEKKEWDHSKSKTATELTKQKDGSYTSEIALSIPSEEESLASDIVFAIDDSQCGKEASEAAQEMVADLVGQMRDTKAKIKVGVVIFGGTAIQAFPLQEIADEEDIAALNEAMSEAASENLNLHGSNIQSGLIEADNMLSADKKVKDERKYLVLISDGHTYQFSKEGDYTTQYFGEDRKCLTTYGIYNDNDLYSYAYGISYTIHSLHDQYYTGDYDEDGTYHEWGGSYLTDDRYLDEKGNPSNEYEMPYGTWAQYYAHIKSVVKKDNGAYDTALKYEDGNYANQCIGANKADRAQIAADLGINFISCGLEDGTDTALQHASGVDRSVYEAYNKYASMAEKYHCYPVYVTRDKEDAARTEQDYGYQLMAALDQLSGAGTVKFCGQGETPEVANIFGQIQNDIYYAVDAGSSVEDAMGYKEGEYNFDLVNDAAALKLKVGTKKLTAVSISTSDEQDVYGFGDKLTNGTYPYVLTYTKATDENEKFVLTFNVPVSNFNRVELSYSVKLVSAVTKAGTYGQYDKDGSKGYDGWYTNNYAVLKPVDSDGTALEAEYFAKPTVSYTAEETEGNAGSTTQGTVDGTENKTEQAEPIVNTTNVAVGKVWQDGENQDGIRPSSVTVQLYRNGEAYGDPVTLSDANSWWYRWDHLDAESSWTVDELNVAEGYTKSFTKNAVNAWVIVNTHTPQTQAAVTTDTAAAAGQSQNPTGRGAGTGDEGNLMMWLVLMLASGALAAGVVIYRRRGRC